MEASNNILKIIVEACCRSLQYKDNERQFAFTFNLYLNSIWKNIEPLIKTYDSHFYLSDFNRVLSNIENSIVQFHRIPIDKICDKEIMNGEVLEIGTVTRTEIVLIKMKAGQYLNVNTGQGLSLGSSFQFEVGKFIETSEAKNLGACKYLFLRIPRKEHVALSSYYLGDYYHHKIATSLWPIVDIAEDVCRGKCNECGKLLKAAQNSGINTYSLLNLLKGVSVYYAKNASHH